jgi:hypothetical protein
VSINQAGHCKLLLMLANLEQDSSLMTQSPLGILVCFRQFWDRDPLLQAVFPWYNRAVLGVIFPDSLTLYQCSDSENTLSITPYSRCVFTWDNFISHSANYRLLKLRVSQAECQKIHGVCEACSQAKLKYHLSDLMLSFVPFRNPPDLSIDKVKSVRNVQAVVLILRECLDASENTLGTELTAINSRTINPTGLYQIIQPHAWVYYPSKRLDPRKLPEKIEATLLTYLEKTGFID